MMRTLLLTALLFLVFAAACATVKGNAVAAEPSNFLSWALDKSSECDLRWNCIAAVSGTGGSSSLSDGTGTALVWPSLGKGAAAGLKLSHNIMPSGPFFHNVTDKASFLPLTTRKRGGAARGAQVLQSPADAQLEVPYDIKRPLNSSVQQKNFFAPFGDVSRPRLNSFGRIYSKDDHLFRGAVSRPAYRADRPRIL